MEILALYEKSFLITQANIVDSEIFIEGDRNYINIYIDKEQQCYEDFGYFVPSFLKEELEGKIFKSVTVIYDEEKTKKLKQETDERSVYAIIIKIIVNDKKGNENEFDINVYNIHKGFYGHQVLIDTGIIQ